MIYDLDILPPHPLCSSLFLSFSVPNSDDTEIMYSLYKYRGHSCLINTAKQSKKPFLFTYTLIDGEQEKSVDTKHCLENVSGEMVESFKKK